MPTSMRYQPQGIIRLSKTGICNGIVDVWVGSNALNILSNNNVQSLSITGAPPGVLGSWGKGVQFDGSSQFYHKTAAAISSTAESTILAVVIPSNTSATTRSIFGYGNTSSANQLLFIGQGSTAGQISFFARSDANTSQNLQVAGGSGWASGVPAVLLGTRSESKNTHSIHLNGVSISSTTATVLGTSTFNRTTVGALVRSSNALHFNGGVYLTISWNRSLSAEEIREISANPWSIFESNDEFEEIQAASGDGTANISGVSAAYTLGAITVTGDAASSIAGISASYEIGTISTSAEGHTSISGVSSTYEIGSIVCTGQATSTITGINLQADVGTISNTADALISVIGNSSSLDVGTISGIAAGNTDISGVSCTYDTGTVVINVHNTGTITGLSAVYEIGSLGTLADGNTSISGVSSTYSVGTINATSEDVVNGTAEVSGQSSSYSTGTILASGSSIVVLLEQSSSTSTGTITCTGTANVVIDGVDVNPFTGIIQGSVDSQAIISGVEASTSVGTISPYVSSSITLTSLESILTTGSINLLANGTANVPGVSLESLPGIIVAFPGEGLPIEVNLVGVQSSIKFGYPVGRIRDQKGSFGLHYSRTVYSGNLLS